MLVASPAEPTPLPHIATVGLLLRTWLNSFVRRCPDYCVVSKHVSPVVVGAGREAPAKKDCQSPMDTGGGKGGVDARGSSVDNEGSPPAGRDGETTGQGKNTPSNPVIANRGKPEAMATALAAEQVEANRLELEQELRDGKAGVGSDDEGAAVEAVVEAEPMDEDTEVVGGVLATLATPPKRSPKPKPKSTPRKRSASSPKRARKLPTKPPAASPRTELLLEEDPPKITDEEYENLEALMVQFCRVPLLSEFSRPVSLLHPEVSGSINRCTIFSFVIDLPCHLNVTFPLFFPLACGCLQQDCHSSRGPWPRL